MEDVSTDQGAQQAYWNQLVLLKAVSCYVGHYRDEQARWIGRIGLFKALVTSGTIGAWAIWKDYAFAWAILLGATQALDAAKDHIPQVRHQRNASEFVSVLESLVIEARFEWFGISKGYYTADQVMDRWRSLAMMLHENERKYFPDGIPVSRRRFKVAQAEAMQYMENPTRTIRPATEAVGK